MAKLYVRNTANTDWEEQTGFAASPDGAAFNSAAGWVRDSTNSFWVPISSHTVVEDFENWNSTLYRGDMADFSVDTNSPVHSGTHSLKSSNTTASRHIYSFPGTGQTIFPQQGQTFGCWVQILSSGARPMWYFGFHDTNQHYRVSIGESSAEILINNFGAISTLSSSAPTLARDTWYFMEVTWGVDGSIQLRVLDVTGDLVTDGSTSTTDTTFGNGGYGFRNAGDAPRNVAYDYFIIYN